IRGPQGAALYGADAISGVINIVTRHDVDAGLARVRSTGGVTASDYSTAAPLTQDHRFALDFGPAPRSANVSAALSSLGAFYPGASSRTLQATGATRVIGERTVFTGTARLYDGWVGAAANPLLATAAGGATSAPQSLREYTLG